MSFQPNPEIDVVAQNTGFPLVSSPPPLPPLPLLGDAPAPALVGVEGGLVLLLLLGVEKVGWKGSLEEGREEEERK